MSDSSLTDTLEALRRRIHSASRRRMNEQNTKATLIEPLLRALGWDTEDVEEVVREYKGKRQRRPVDYGLLTRREPRLLVEAKQLGARLDDNRWASQIMGYASVAGVRWMVLTDGDEYRIYNTHAAVPIEQKLWRSVRVSDDAPVVQETLELLARDRLDENRIDALWQAHFVDRQVRRALTAAFESDDDRSLVNLVRKHAPKLTRPEVRASLRRCQVTLDFPLSHAELVKRARKSKERPARRRRKRKPDTKVTSQRQVSVLDLIEAGRIKAPMTIYRTYKKQRLTATIEKDGTIRFGKDRFTSLSLAGAAARASIVGTDKHGKNPPTNGWRFWCTDDVERGGTPIDELRQSLAK